MSEFKEDHILDQYTFGNSAAAQVLVEILQNKEPQHLTKVSRIYSEYCLGIRQISTDIQDRHLRESLLNMWFDRYRNWVESSLDGADCQSFLLNIMKRKWRIFKTETKD